MSRPRTVDVQVCSKHHLNTPTAGVPLAIILTGGNRNDVTQVIPPLGCPTAGSQAVRALVPCRGASRRCRRAWPAT